MSRPLLFCYSAIANSNYNIAQSGGASGLSAWKANVQAFESMASSGQTPVTIDGYQCFCSTEYTSPATASGMASAAWDYAGGFVWAQANGVPLTAMLTAVELASTANGASYNGNNSALQATASGAWDVYYQDVISQFAAAGCKTLYVRIQWEQNGGWYVGWAGYEPAYQWNDYIAAWRHVAGVLHAAGAASGIVVKTVWNPAAIASSGGYVPGSWPGSGYVDVVGLDLYSSYIQWGSAAVSGTAAKELAWDTADGTSSGVQNPEPTSGSYGWGILDHIAFAKSQGLPIAIPESGDGAGGAPFGIANDSDFPTYVASRLAQAAASGVPVEFWSIWVGAFDLTWDAPASYPAAIAQVLALGSPAPPPPPPPLAITVAGILNQQQVPAAANLTVAGWLGGYSTPPTLEYSLDGVSFYPLPAGSVVTSGTFSFPLALTAAQSYNIWVKDSAGTEAESNQFTIYAPS